ncbi:Fe-S cluster assembly scaffold protein NifU [candidate division WOR-3 bacterium 4484_100]|uniref:Fe-S cluster assembly scaffold protein NifU n=1 Tax=candidate division WOR-3 bacterium 4484_100 TaxID=1936077 RepID=A0A1V4QG14_UNCW3|nr:MAG: Fe-S cluster assembly scaffold protein NifU [candidate division WOR-3 bacterium 4484_100]
MKSTTYSDKVLDHFRNPRNVGVLEGEDIAVGRVGNPVCGDLMEIYIKVEDNTIKDIKFKTFGCGSAIATASMITELAKGKSVEEAEKITRKDVAEELDGLPPIKMHCSNLAADALRAAIKNYKKKENQPEPAKTEFMKITGVDRFKDGGVYHKVVDINRLKDKRVIILDRGEDSVSRACSLQKISPRVIFITPNQRVAFNRNFEERLRKARVKILFESEVLEIIGTKTVEKIKIHDLNEDEVYELFADAIIL